MTARRIPAHSPAVSSPVHPRGSCSGVSVVVSVLLMRPIVCPGEFPCYSLGMDETAPDITENSNVDTMSLREWIAKHSDHLDQGIHEVQQQLTAVAAELSVMRGQLAEVHAELEAAKPMIERWQHSKIVKLAGGTMPWAKGAST